MKTTLTLAAVLLALPLACAFADDEEPPAEPPPAEQPQNPGIAPTPIGEGARRTLGNGKLDKDPTPSPADLQEAGLGASELKKYRFKIFEGMPDGAVSMPDKPNGIKSRMHGSLYFPDKYDAYAVAIHVVSPQASGLCSTVDEAWITPTDETCNYKYWISAKPGGPPVRRQKGAGPVEKQKETAPKASKLCVDGSGWNGGGLTWHGYNPEVAGCGLKPGTYYCNIISLWEARTRKCGLLLSAPLVQRL